MIGANIVLRYTGGNGIKRSIKHEKRNAVRTSNLAAHICTKWYVWNKRPFRRAHLFGKNYLILELSESAASVEQRAALVLRPVPAEAEPKFCCFHGPQPGLRHVKDVVFLIFPRRSLGLSDGLTLVFPGSVGPCTEPKGLLHLIFLSILRLQNAASMRMEIFVASSNS